MRILITGNMGYVGSVLSQQLRRAHSDATLIGFDAGYFAHCLTTQNYLPEIFIDRQIFGDTRDLPSVEDLKGVDAVVHLAAISNDPIGNQFEQITHDVNQAASLKLAELAKKAGVHHFVFASSCSVYGAGSDAPRTEQDAVNPLTAYARSKVGTELGLKDLADSKFTVTCLRFATACGYSLRLRLDLVVNDFVAAALTSKKITILSDGSPWRPLIHVKDMARAIDWATQRNASKGGNHLIVNTGSDGWNYQVKDLAKAVCSVLPGTDLSIATDAQPDKRSYRVNFDLFRSLAPDAQPQETLEGSIKELAVALQQTEFSDADFRKGPLMRLHTLQKHRTEGRLDTNLRWIRE